MGCNSKRVECCKWVRKKCAGIPGSLLLVKNSECKSCQVVEQKRPEKEVNLDGDALVVEKFS